MLICIKDTATENECMTGEIAAAISKIECIDDVNIVYDKFPLLVSGKVDSVGIKKTLKKKLKALFIFGKLPRFITLSTKPYSNVPASELGLRDDIWAEK